MQRDSLTLWLVMLISVISVKIGVQNLEWVVKVTSTLVAQHQHDFPLYPRSRSSDEK
ncbi:MAG TPA: hypothetical protein V6D50_08280 [Chroococcales cyanobacterium]